MGVHHEAYEEYLDNLYCSSYEALRSPLSEGQVLTPLRPASFDYQKVLGLCSSPQPDSRLGLRTWTSHRPNRLPNPGIQKSGLRLVRPLSPQDARTWAQVWVATTVDMQHPHSEHPVEVVVKLFQESRFPEQEIEAVADGYLWTGESLSHTESWAFDTLKELQGTLLPYSYGFYEFRLPCGQDVCGHVMELVRGAKLQRDWESVDNGSWYEIGVLRCRARRLDTFMNSVHELHARGVLHGDLDQPNVIVPYDRPDCFVFIDLACAKTLTPGNGRFSAELRDELSGVMECLACISDIPSVYIWLSKHAPRSRWRGMYAHFPVEELWSMMEPADMDENVFRHESGAA